MQSPIRPMSAGYVSSVPCGSRGQCSTPGVHGSGPPSCSSVQQCGAGQLSGRATTGASNQPALWQQASNANLRRRAPQAGPPQVHPTASESARTIDHLNNSRPDYVAEGAQLQVASTGSFIPPTAAPNLHAQAQAQASRPGGSCANGGYVIPAACAGSASPPRQQPNMPLTTLTSLAPSVEGSPLVTLEQLPAESLAHAASVNFPQNQAAAVEVISPGRPISRARPTRASITKSPSALPTTTQAAQSLKLFAFGGALPNGEHPQAAAPLEHFIPPPPDGSVSIVSAADLQAAACAQAVRQASDSSPDGHGRRQPVEQAAFAYAPSYPGPNGPPTPIGTMPLTPTAREPNHREEAVRVEDENLDTTREVPRVMQQIQWKVTQAMGETASRQVIASAVKVQMEDASKQPRASSAEASTGVSSEGQVAESPGTDGDLIATPALSVQALEPPHEVADGPGENTLFAITSACRSSVTDSVLSEPVQFTVQAAVQEHILQQQRATAAMQATLRSMKAERADRENAHQVALQQVKQQMDNGLAKAQAAVAAWPNRHDLMATSVHALQNQISDLNSIARSLSGEAGLTAQVQGLTSERQRVLDTLAVLRKEQEAFRMMLNEEHNDIAQLTEALASLPGSNGTGGATVEDMEELHILQEEVMVVTTSVKELCTRVDDLSDSEGLGNLRIELSTLTGIVGELSKKVDGLTIASVSAAGGKPSERQLGVRTASQSSASSLDGVTATAQALRERLSKLLGDVQRGGSQAGSVVNDQ